MTLSDRIRQKAVEMGFDAVGIAPAAEALHAMAFCDWLARGYQAGMSWMAQEPEARASLRLAVPGARSVVIAGFSYFVCEPPDEIWNDPGRGRIARYAWGRDYHDVLKPLLQELARFIRGEAGPDVTARACIDTAPILEREAAARAGLGFIGRNSMLIHPERGSYLFLGEIVTSLELEYDEPCPNAGPTACGRCRRCLDACPTGAFPKPYVVDSGRCVSYLTIEHRGSIPEDLRPLMGNWIFGCDECQSVCPWVKRCSRPREKPFLDFDPDFAAPRLLDLLNLDAPGFRSRYSGSPVMRAHYHGFLRNACVAAGNWGDSSALPALERIARQPEPLIAEHARWAMERIRARPRTAE